MEVVSAGSQQQFQILVDGNAIGSVAPSSTNYALYNSASFNLSAGMHTITLKGLDPHGGDNTALVDQVFLDWL